MESQVKQLEFIVNETKQLLDEHIRARPMSDPVGLKHWLKTKAAWERKLSYHLKAIIRLGATSSVIQAKGTFITDVANAKGTFRMLNNGRVRNKFELYFTGITLEDAETLVKYKFKNVKIVTISFKEIPSGVFIYT